MLAKRGGVPPRAHGSLIHLEEEPRGAVWADDGVIKLLYPLAMGELWAGEEIAGAVDGGAGEAAALAFLNELIGVELFDEGLEYGVDDIVVRATVFLIVPLRIGEDGVLHPFARDDVPVGKDVDGEVDVAAILASEDVGAAALGLGAVAFDDLAALCVARDGAGAHVGCCFRD